MILTNNKPCPFCGNDFICTRIDRVPTLIYTAQIARAICDKCYSTGPIVYVENDDTGSATQKAEDLWNDRIYKEVSDE